MENRDFYAKATITLADGTVLPLTDGDILQGGVSFEDAVSGNGSFQIGAAIIGKHKLTLSNYSGKFDDYEFTGATVVPYVGLQLSETIEYLKKGFYTVDDPGATGNIITLECLDNMHKFERPFSEVNLTFPATAISALTAICAHCGVVLNTATFTNADFIIKERPIGDAITCLDIVSYIAQIAGCYARCNVDGALELKWYDLDAFEGEDQLDGGSFKTDEITVTRIEGASYQEHSMQGKNLASSVVYLQGSSYNNAVVAEIEDFQPDTVYTLSIDLPVGERFYINEYIFKEGPVATPVGTGNRISMKVTTVSALSKDNVLQYNNNQYGVGWRIYKVSNGYTASGTASNFQIERGDTATPYEPFIPSSPSPKYPSPILSANNFTITASKDGKSNSVTINDTLRSNLSKTVRDTYEIIDGVLTKVQRLNEVVFDGSEDENWTLLNNQTDYVEFSLPYNMGTTGVLNSVNSHFPNTTSSRIVLVGNSVCLRFPKSVSNYPIDVASFKLWLQSNPLTVLYELPAPIYAPISPITLQGYGSGTEITIDAYPEVTIETTSKYNDGDNADGGNFTDYTSGDSVDGGTFIQAKKYHHFYNFGSNPTIAVDDVVITGVKVEIEIDNEKLSHLYGETGYILSIVNNPLIQSKSDAELIAATVGQKIVGMRFRPFSANILSDPSIEAGDPCIVSIRTSRGIYSYQSFVTSLSYTIGQRETVRCDAETPSRNSSIRYSAQTKAIVEERKKTQQKFTAYNLAVQQLTNLMANSFGVFKTEQVLEDGSVVYYMHNKPTLAESQTIWKMTSDAFAVSTDGGQTWNAGFDSNGNVVVNILNAIGINADWINAGTIRGIEIITNRGKIAGLNITENGFASDNDIIAITNDYDKEGKPIQGLIKVRNSIPDVEKGVADSYTEVNGDGVRIVAGKSADPENHASDIASLDAVFGLGMKKNDEHGHEVESLTIKPMVIQGDNPDKFFIIQPNGGSESILFDGESGMALMSNTAIDLLAPNVYISNAVIDGRTMLDIESAINYNLAFIWNIVVALQSRGIIVDPPPQ